MNLWETDDLYDIVNSLFLIYRLVLDSNEEIAVGRIYTYKGWDAISEIFQTMRAPIDRIKGVPITSDFDI